MTRVSPGWSMSLAFCSAALSEPSTSAVPDWATVIVRLGKLEPASDREVQATLVKTHTAKAAPAHRVRRGFIRSITPCSDIISEATVRRTPCGGEALH